MNKYIFIIALLAGITACILSYLIYGTHVLLSGDQSPQIVAAESLANGEGLLIPPMQMPEGSMVKTGGDYREKLFWYPPGYSLLLAFFTCMGSSIAGASLILFYLNKAVSNILWVFVARRYGIPLWQFFVVFVFQSVAYMPATTTDQFLWPVVGLMFLLFPIRGRWVPVLISLLICLAISLRWFGILLPSIWLGWTYFTATRNDFKCLHIHLRAWLPVFVCLPFFLGLTYYVAGNLQPYTAIPVLHIKWGLLWKGIYFAINGGVSSMWKVLQFSLVALCAFTLLSLVKQLFTRRKSIPVWVSLSVLFQAAVFAFLIYTQYKKGSMYDPAVPAFATARFYFLCQPLSFAAVIWAGSLALSNRKVMRHSFVIGVATVYLGAAFTYVPYNKHNIAHELASCRRGFLRPKEVVFLEAKVNEIKPDFLIQLGGWPEVFSIYDPKKIIPCGVHVIPDAFEPRILKTIDTQIVF
jgi:hypothetical protein